MRRPPYVVPSRHDRLVATATRAIGGPVGRFAAIGTRGLGAVAASLIALAGVLLALGVFQKGHCVVKGWANPDQFWRACYSDVPVVHVTSALAQRHLPWSGSGSDQPLLSGLVMWLIARLSPSAGDGVGAQQWVFTLWVGLAMIMLGMAVLAAVGLLPGDPWHASHLAASPVLVVLALISTDLVGIALVLWAWWAWTRSHPAVAGALLGLAFLVRPFPLLFLIALVLVALRDDRVREAATAVVSAALAALALFLPSLILIGEGILAAPRNWWSSGPGYGALALIPQSLSQCRVDLPWCRATKSLSILSLTPVAATAIALAGWALAIAVGWWLAHRSALRPNAVQVAAVMVLIVALTAKSLSVQSGLWLLPLLALSGIRWRDHLIWAAAEIVHFEATWLHIGFSSDAGKGLPAETYAMVIVLRMVAWAWVLWQVWESPARHRSPLADAVVTGPKPAFDVPESGHQEQLARRGP